MQILRYVSYAALAGVLVPCVLNFAGVLNHEMVKWLALLSTFVWFAVTPCWMGRELGVDAAEVEI